MRPNLPCLILSLASLGACGPSNVAPRRELDLAMEPDGAIHIADLATQIRDLAFPGTLLRFVVNRVDLPASKGQYAFDENGDNLLDNQFAVLLQSLAAAGFSFMQASQNLAITVDGSALELLSLATLDAKVDTDPGAYATLHAGRPQKFPELGGTGAFVVDPQGGSGRVDGALAGGVFSSKDPARLVTDVKVPLRLGFWSSQQTTLPLHGAHLVFTVPAGGQTVMGGQLQGVVTAADVQRIVAAALAADMSAIAARPSCAQDADCRNVKKVIDLDGDGKVDVTEINQGPLGAALRSDVEMFDAMGRYAPSPANNNRNAWSVGVAFTAVKASFDEP